MKLLAATRSAGKQAEIRRILASAGHQVVFPDEAGLAERPDEEDQLELGESFGENARRKAEYFARRAGLATFADDSGLEVFSLGGAPGVRSRRWAGGRGSPAEIDTANNAELLRRLLGAPPVKRAARYRCVIALVRHPSGPPEMFEGQCAGRILEAATGVGGFGYDPLFLSADLGKSFGEATAEEKDSVSHRARALRAMAAALESHP